MNKSVTMVLAIFSVCGVLTAQMSTSQAETPLTPQQALEMAVEANPELRGTRIEAERADLGVEVEETARTPTFRAETGYRYGLSPDLSSEGTSLIDSSSLTFSTGLSHVLPIGTQIAMSAALGRSARDSVVLGDLGIAYDAQVGADISQPLLRGFGRDVVEAPIEAARLSRKSFDAQQRATTSAIVLDILSTYWDLWLAEETVEIQEAALEIAEESLEHGEIRREAGDIASAELISLRMEVASARERLATSRSQVRQRSTALATLLGHDPEADFRARTDTPEAMAIPEMEDALERYREQSYELARLEFAVESAELQASLAHNQALPRLDAVGSFYVDGLDRNIGGAFSQIGRFEGWVVFAGLRLEMPVNNRSRRAEAERADLAVRSAEVEYERVDANLKSRLLTLIEDAHTARERAELAMETAELAQQNVDAQTARFEVGRGTTLEVVDAMQRHREAEQRLVEAEVNLVRQLLAVEDLTGDLLARWGVEP